MTLTVNRRAAREDHLVDPNAPMLVGQTLTRRATLGTVKAEEVAAAAAAAAPAGVTVTDVARHLDTTILNAEATVLNRGEIVRVDSSAPRAVRRMASGAGAGARVLGIVLAQVQPNTQGDARFSGVAQVLLEIGLASVTNGAPVYASATAGRGTTVAPTSGGAIHEVGTIVDAASYATDASVLVQLARLMPISVV